MSEHFDADEIKRRLPMIELLEREGIECRRDGAKHKARCPFHEERSGSFIIYSYPDSREDHGHCFGCGWNGDIIKYWREKRGAGFVEALRDLASLASVSPSAFRENLNRAAQVPRMTEVAPGGKEKPALPRLRALTDDELSALARLRKLSVEGVKAAGSDRRVGGCVWPQFIGRPGDPEPGTWHTPSDSTAAWVVTDLERRVAQFRRLDGECYVRRDGGKIKAWTCGSPTWPLGASEIGDRAGVLLVEGGADMLAGYHFLAKFERLHAVAVVAMLGASCAICAEALPFFERKRVRIMMDEDEERPKPGKPGVLISPGREAAARWTAQLTEAGAAVETFSLAGLVKRDLKTKVKDLNDLAEVDEAAWLDDELRAAFYDFDF
ncbi:MAG: CHC2 zinc finger domain-containing protein [Chthoniobacteraceae bacterium]